MINNSHNGLIHFPTPIIEPEFIPGIFSNIGSGDVDLYTVPANRAAILSQIITTFNSAGTSTVLFYQIKVGGTYYRIASDTNLATLSLSLVTAGPMVLNAGESISVNTSQAGINASIKLLEMNPITLLKTIRILSLSNGDNVLYTVPTGKSSNVLPTSMSAIDGNTASIQYVNDSGGSRNLTGNGTPNGGSLTQFHAVTIADNTRQAVICPNCLGAGDSITVNTNSGTATQTAWVNVIEI